MLFAVSYFARQGARAVPRTISSGCHPTHWTERASWAARRRSNGVSPTRTASLVTTTTGRSRSRAAPAPERTLSGACHAGGRSWGGRETGANGKRRRRGRGRLEKEKGKNEQFSFPPVSPRPLHRCFLIAPVSRPPHDLPLGFEDGHASTWDGFPIDWFTPNKMVFTATQNIGYCSMGHCVWCSNIFLFDLIIGYWSRNVVSNAEHNVQHAPRKMLAK